MYFHVLSVGYNYISTRSLSPSKVAIVSASLRALDYEIIDEYTLPHMGITFADGTMDEIFLTIDPENGCFFHGSIKAALPPCLTVSQPR